MTTPGDMRRAQRRRARADERAPAKQELTPLELAIERKLREHARKEAPKEEDARAIAFQVVKHWGDDAPKVLELATEYVRDEVGRWTPKAPETAPPPPPGGGDPGDKR